MSGRILGIDPGLTGAFAVLDCNGDLVAVEDLPVIRDATSAWIDADTLLSRLLALREGHDLHAVIERVHAMPRNGSVAAFSQGCTFGSTLATLQLARARIEFVAPRTWKRDVGLISDRKHVTDLERKNMSLAKARLMFPNASLDRQKDHGRAEALLIALWHYTRTNARRVA